jgi:hypothetical protein
MKGHLPRKVMSWLFQGTGSLVFTRYSPAMPWTDSAVMVMSPVLIPWGSRVLYVRP